MELKTVTKKRVINCLEEQVQQPEELVFEGIDTTWFLSVLAHDEIEIDFFETLQDDDYVDYGDVISWCLNVIAYSDCGIKMLQEACDQEWQITMDDLRGGEYCIDVENRMLTLDHNALDANSLGRSVYFRNVTMLTLIKAIRDIWQEKRHGGFDEHYGPKDILTMERMRAADLDVLAVLVAWELRGDVYPDLWRHMLGSEIGDLAMTFVSHMERTPSKALTASALASAFRQWFVDEKRVNDCDHDALEYMDEVLSFSEELNPFGDKTPTKMSIEILSTLPNKTAYLQGRGTEILTDGHYTAMHDEINQKHLYHVMYDLEAIVVEDVPFRDETLARKIFPEVYVDA